MSGISIPPPASKSDLDKVVQNVADVAKTVSTVGMTADGATLAAGKAKTDADAAKAVSDAAKVASDAAKTAADAVQASIASVAATVPTPGTSTPPAVTDMGAAGSATKQYAMADHTHPSKARKAVKAVNTATYTWVYPTPFASGVIPVCNGIAQCPVGTTDVVNVQLDGVPTNTQCVFRITRTVQSAVSLIGLTVLSINVTPLSLNLHMEAFEP
jgi:hypothetical protein